MTYADDFSLRDPNFYSANKVADAIDGVRSQAYGGVSTGSSNAYAITCSPAINAGNLVVGQLIGFYPNHNNTGGSSLNVNGMGAVSLLYLDRSLVGGELLTTSFAYVAYNGSNWQLLNHGGGWGAWTPTYGATGSMTFTSVTTVYAKFQRHGSRVFGIINANGTTGGTTSTGLTFTLPVTAANTNSGGALGHCVIGEAGTAAGFVRWSSTSVAICERYDQANITLAAGRALSARFEYEV